MHGWLRLWVLAALVIWLAGAVHLFVRYQETFFMDRYAICHSYYPSDEAEACLSDHRVFSVARDWHWADLFSAWRLWPFWPYWLAPVALGLLTVGGVWVQRGFNRRG